MCFTINLHNFHLHSCCVRVGLHLVQLTGATMLLRMFDSEDFERAWFVSALHVQARVREHSGGTRRRSERQARSLRDNTADRMRLIAASLYRESTYNNKRAKDTLYHRAQLDPENTLVCPKYN